MQRMFYNGIDCNNSFLKVPRLTLWLNLQALIAITGTGNSVNGFWLGVLGKTGAGLCGRTHPVCDSRWPARI